MRACNISGSAPLRDVRYITVYLDLIGLLKLLDRVIELEVDSYHGLMASHSHMATQHEGHVFLIRAKLYVMIIRIDGSLIAYYVWLLEHELFSPDILYVSCFLASLDSQI